MGHGDFNRLPHLAQRSFGQLQRPEANHHSSWNCQNQAVNLPFSRPHIKWVRLYIYNYTYTLVGGRPTLWRIWKSVGKDYPIYYGKNKTCSKPPTSIYIYIYRSNQLSSDRIEAMVFAQLLPRALKAGAGQQHLELEGWGKTSSTCWTCWHLLGGQAVYY